MGIVEGKKEALLYDVLVEMGMKLFVWFDLVGLVSYHNYCSVKHNTLIIQQRSYSGNGAAYK